MSVFHFPQIAIYFIILFIYFGSNNTFLTNHTLKFKHQPGHWKVNPLNAELNPTCHLLALLAHLNLHVSRIRVNIPFPDNETLLSIQNTAAKPIAV